MHSLLVFVSCQIHRLHPVYKVSLLAGRLLWKGAELHAFVLANWAKVTLQFRRDFTVLCSVVSLGSFWVSQAPPVCLHVAPLSHKGGGHVGGELKSKERERGSPQGLIRSRFSVANNQFALIVVLGDTSYLKGSSNF